MSGKSYNYSSTHRALEIAAICVFAVFAIANAKLIVEALDGPLAFAVLLGALVTGYLCADLISGTVHWLADRFGTVETPIFGANFIVPFRRHHVYPKEITEHDFIETNGNNCIVSFWILPLAYFGFPPAAGAPGGLFLFATVEATILAVMATNQFHKWAHQDVPPRFVQVLQRLHLVLPPDHHDIHHTAPFDTYFCITTGWLNWPLRKLRVFEAFEWTIARVLGIKAGEDDQKTLAQIHAPPPGVATPAAS